MQHQLYNNMKVQNAQDMRAMQSNIRECLNYEFFTRTVLAALEIIRVLQTRDSILHEGFGIGAGGDKSSGGDLVAEAIFCKFLAPVYNIDSEEAGFIQADILTKWTIVLDPLDGSSNFKSNIPYYGASLALCDENGKVREACVINYISQEMSYLNELLLKITHVPCIFTLDSIGLYLSFTIEDSETEILGMNNGSLQGILSYRPFDFSPLFSYQWHIHKNQQNLKPQGFNKESIKDINSQDSTQFSQNTDVKPQSENQLQSYYEDNKHPVECSKNTTKNIAVTDSMVVDFRLEQRSDSYFHTDYMQREIDIANSMTCNNKLDDKKSCNIASLSHHNQSALRIKKICEYILKTKHYLPTFTKDFLHRLFEHKVIIHRFEHSYPVQVLECGIFEKASYYPKWVEFLLSCKLKFRSLGATALSLGFSFRYLFVLLPSSVRKYDGMAGFYLAQHQYIKGNIAEYIAAIPTLRDSLESHKHIVISKDSNIAKMLSTQAETFD